MSKATAPDECANCGVAIPPGARACPECGADEKTGWREQSVYDGIDLPDEEFSESKSSQTNAAAWWKLTCVLLVVFFVVMVWRGV